MTSGADLEARRLIAEKACRAAAAFHMHYRQPRIEYATKNHNPRDLVTAADTEAQTAARAVIEAAFPGEPIIGEEDGSSRTSQAGILSKRGWLIDPLDGTFNYVHGFPDFSATVAYVEEGQPLAAATFAPALGEMFSAARGYGTTYNSRPASVSHRRGLAKSIVNFWPGSGKGNPANALQERVQRKAFSVRNFGGTAIVLAYVACGRFDLFYAGENPRMGAWDVAAGALLVQEAGGTIAKADGSPFLLPTTSMAAAADAATLEELLALVRS